MGAKREDLKNPFIKHSKEHHAMEKGCVEFNMKVLRRFKTPLARQISEAVLIESSRADQVLNSKGEWGGSRLPRLTVEVGDRVSQVEYQGKAQPSRRLVHEPMSKGNKRKAGGEGEVEAMENKEGVKDAKRARARPETPARPSSRELPQQPGTLDSRGSMGPGHPTPTSPTSAPICSRSARPAEREPPRKETNPRGILLPAPHRTSSARPASREHPAHQHQQDVPGPGRVPEPVPGPVPPPCPEGGPTPTPTRTHTKEMKKRRRMCPKESLDDDSDDDVDQGVPDDGRDPRIGPLPMALGPARREPKLRPPPTLTGARAQPGGGGSARPSHRKKSSSRGGGDIREWLTATSQARIPVKVLTDGGGGEGQ